MFRIMGFLISISAFLFYGWLKLISGAWLIEIALGFSLAYLVKRLWIEAREEISKSMRDVSSDEVE